jgi:hypothetical protein
MPSRVEMRRQIERFLRGIVVVALAILLWQSLGSSSNSVVADSRARGLSRSALVSWSAAPSAPSRIHVALDSVPTAVERAWLAGIAGAGTTVSWSGNLAPVIVDAQSVAAPAGGTRLLIAAPRGSTVVVSDDIGVIDTVQPQNAGAAIALGAHSDRLGVRVKGSTASTIGRDSLALHRALVIAGAGWESKFVVAALEEEGWKVDAFIRVAPGVDVTQGPLAAIDTSRYSAVVALDSTASAYADRIVRFVRDGGGVVLGPSAATVNAMSQLRAGTIGSIASGSSESGTAVALTTLPLRPITSFREDAIPLEKRGGAVAVAARRFVAGRVVQLGYEDTWSWRMSGGESGLAEHRRWWTGVVSRVAYAPVVPAAIAGSGAQKSLGEFHDAGEESPVADLVASIGQRATESNPRLRKTSIDLTVLLFAVLSLALVGEIASRRTRGVE